ncbi:CHAT domain-containing protein [Candidatus Halobeggiatoa sp. HSG11]|nr:CHAT domain-containing protein [Candidatus Halobeggiatoa sp. HSG11]
MKTTEQLVEEAIKNNFAKPLPKTQHDLAAKVIREIFYETQDLSFEELQRRVKQLELEFADITEGRFAYLILQRTASEALERHFNKMEESVTYLKKGVEQAKIWLTEDDTSIRNVTLVLCIYLGITQRELGQVTEAIKTYQNGLKYAQDWLNDASVWELILKLYVNLGVAQGKLGQFEQGLKHAQDWLDDYSVWKQVLKLYYNLGITQIELGQVTEAIKTYQNGLKYAQNWLDDASVRKQVLKLYDVYSNACYNSGQSFIFLSPYDNFWSWTILQNLSKHFDRILSNLKKRSENSPSLTKFTTVFQAFLHTFLLSESYEPIRSRRLHSTTEILLKISETLYLIEQLEENQRLQTINHNLQNLIEIDVITELFSLQNKISNSKEDLTGFQNLSGLPYLLAIPKQWLTKYRLHKSQTQSQEINDSILTESEYKQQLKQIKSNLTNWLYHNIKPNDLTESLRSLPAIVQGMLFASRCTTGNPAKILAEWLQNQPWNNPDATEFLQTTFSATNWQQWITEDPDRPNRPLSFWRITNYTNNIKINWEVSSRIQPEIRNWLQELNEGNADNLINQLKFAWQQAVEQADSLTKVLNKFGKQENNLIVLQAVILGQESELLTNTIQTWLFPPQDETEDETDVLTVVNNLKNGLSRAASIYQPTYPSLADTVHDWTKVLISESKPDRSSIPVRFEGILWQLLERSRIALTGQSKELPEDWQEDLGNQLWNSLKNSINLIETGYNTEGKTWPLFTTWLSYFDKYLPETPTWQQCQQHLQPKEALLQLFFEQEQLRVLWLDQNGLQLRDLPEFTVNTASWNDAIEILGKKSESSTREEFKQAIQTMETVMAELQPFAQILKEWANELEQITVIFPAPLGQFPWETLPELENILVRAISLNTWLKESKCKVNFAKKPWIVCDPTADETCTVKEANWLAQHFNTKPESPSHFEALQKFSEYKHIHLTTHGIYEPDHPTASRLSLNEGIELPIWMLNATRTNADLIFLSACESNLAGKATQELLKPIGIGPNLIAAGTKTVVGTLWAYNGFAALCFSYYFYQISEQNPSMSWHKVATQARNAVRDMTHEELEAIIREFDLEHGGEECWEKVVKSIKARSNIRKNSGKKPFDRFDLWAGFVVLGKVKR